MKKVSAILLAMVMTLSMGVTAFAAGTGSITITNATVNQQYDLYKFFNAEYADVPGSTEKAVSYTIETTNQFYDDMFGVDGTAVNSYFDHNPIAHVVTKKSGVGNQDVINYLDSLAATATADESKTATSEEVVFDGLEPGYYLIDRGTTSTVTITTNMPDIKIIDKNQLPGTLFDKVIVEDGVGEVNSNVSHVGDVIDFKIPFTATNYDGDEMVLYYIIEDEKDSGLWVEFEDVEVTVGGTKLDRGYYFFAGAVDSDAETGEWEYLGDWGSETKNPNNAQWYLIHYDYDKFDIIIPWAEPYTFTGTDATNDYELTFNWDGTKILSEPMYDATTNVVVTYSAAVGPDAALTPVSKNEATLKWEHTDGPAGGGTTETTETRTHNLGVKKVSGDDNKPLDGATFELYKDEACTEPLYVIPVVKDGAIVDGVYILDDVDVVITGMERETVREKYAGAALTEWLEDDPNPDGDGTNRRNDLETNDKGELVVLGLEDRTYYVKETEAPAGYNKLALPQAVTVGSGSPSTYAGYTAYGERIVNNKGIELPSTGGEGTVKMITIGTVVAMAFAVLLITHKKMSVYHD